MNTKSSWILLALVMLAILFVPLIPNDTSIDCQPTPVIGGDGFQKECDDMVGYISVYTKFFSQ